MKKKRGYKIHIVSTTEIKMRKWAKAKSPKLKSDVEEFERLGGKVKQIDNMGNEI